jgi:hypothetical protein
VTEYGCNDFPPVDQAGPLFVSVRHPQISLVHGSAPVLVFKARLGSG